MNTVRCVQRVSMAMAATCALVLTACGGGGYGGGGAMGSSACGGAYGGSCTPTVSVSAPAASASVSGTVTLSATAAAKGSYTVTNVQFKVDGTAVGTADATAPYSYDWASTSLADGSHQISATVTDSSGQTATSAPVSVTVANNGTFVLTLSPGQLFPVPASTATGSGTLVFNKTTGQGSGSVTLTGVTATAVEIGDAFAGSSSAALYALTVNSGNANEWDVDPATILTAPQLLDLQAGKLYVLVRSNAFAGGELRAQLLPAGITLKIVPLLGSAEVPAVVSGGSGQAAVTVNSAALSAAVHVNVAGITPTGAELDTGAAGANGALLATLVVDANDVHHYLNESVTLSAADLTNYTNGSWYANVLTAAHAAGELRGQIADPAPTLTQLQSSIFTPICSGCHNGTPGAGNGLPGIQDLRAGSTFAALVDVPSIEQPTLKRVNPGDAANSYIIRKLEGAAGISGVRMPAGGPYLSQATIDQVKSWINAGALNN